MNTHIIPLIYIIILVANAIYGDNDESRIKDDLFDESEQDEEDWNATQQQEEKVMVEFLLGSV